MTDPEDIEEEEDEEFEPIGSIVDTPLAKLMMQIHAAELGGVLHIEGADLKTWIYFEAGRPAGVHAPNSEIYLGMVMRELGMIDDQAFNESLMKMAETNQFQGRVLLDMGAITSEQLERALDVQLVRKASQLFSLHSATYRFADGAGAPERLDAHPVHPAAVIYNGIRNHFEEEDLLDQLEPIADQLIGASPNLADIKAALDLPADELADLDLLSQHRPPLDFANRAASGAVAARMLLLTLYWCGALEVTDPSAAPKPAPAPRPPAPKPKAAAQESTPKKPAPPQPAKKVKLPEAVRERVAKKFDQAQKGNLLALLEVKLDSTPAQIKSAFAALAKQYHPDRAARFADEELSKQLGEIAAKLNAAFEILSDPQKRSDYLNKAIGASDRPVTLNPDAAGVAYTKAKVYIQKKAFKEALDSLRLAARLDPRKAGYKARLIWFECQQDEDKSEDRKRRAKAALVALFDSAPSNFWVNRHLAMISNLLGDAEDYERHLRKAQIIRPDDIDNTREVRLLERRKGKAGDDGKNKKFLGLKLK